MSIFRAYLVIITVLFTLPVQAKRIALVMGNDNYTSVSKLQKAGNDATAMARELKNAGFTVQLHRDLNYRGMVKAVETFANSITGGDEVVVFFAGHGVQIKTGSYLLPTDIEASSESEVEKTAYELLALTDKINEAKPVFTLVMVDACRDNPLKTKGRSVGNARGLSAVEPPKGQIVVYSASRGQQALDRLHEKDPNPNGVFTREFITQMKKPGVKIEEIMREVQDSVESLAKTVNHEQRPAVYNEARGNFYFFPATTAETVSNRVQRPDSNALEIALWESVKNSTSITEIQAYLNQFPNSYFSELARIKITTLGFTKPQSTNATEKNSNEKSDVDQNKSSSQVKPDWTVAFVNSSLTYYVNYLNMERDVNGRVVWMIIDYRNLQKAANGKEFLSQKINLYINCNENLMKYMEITNHSAKMASGNVVYKPLDHDRWSSQIQLIPQESPLFKIRDYACRI